MNALKELKNKNYYDLTMLETLVVESENIFEYTPYAAEELATIQSRLEQAEALVKSVQWESTFDGFYGACPECRNFRAKGHAPDCEIGNLIKSGKREN